MRAQIIGSGLKARIPAPFAVLMRALQLDGADAQTLRSLTDQQWRGLLPMMDRARLTLPFAQLDRSGIPDWVSERLNRNLTDTRLHWDRVVAAYREAASTLDASGIEYLVLKGFTQAPDYVSRPELRRQSDIDFCVPREQIPAAVHSLQKIGYASCDTEETYRFADHVPTLVRFGAWKWNGDIYDPEVPPAIEIHFCLWNDAVSSIAIGEIEEFWERRRVRSSGELTFPALNRVDHVAYFALHILRCVFNEESPVHHVRELATFLDKSVHDDAFWREWSLMHSPRLQLMQAIAFSLAVAWFSCNVPDAVEDEIESLPPTVQNWIEACGGTALETLFRRTRDGRLLQLLLADTPETRKQILWRLAPGRLMGPAMHASAQTHYAMSEKPNLLFSYLSYAAFLCRRGWLAGWALLRFLVDFRKVHASRRTGPAQSWMRRMLRVEERV